MLINNDVVLYENGNFENKIYRINVAKIGKFGISPGCTPYHIFCYLPGNNFYVIIVNHTIKVDMK